MDPNRAKCSTELAGRIRKHALTMVFESSSPHIGSVYSVADILAVLYFDVLRLNVPPLSRDHFILSKGHAAAGLYAVLAEMGSLCLKDLATYAQNGSSLGGHVLSHGNPAVELSTGSLGLGLSVASGLALGAKQDGSDARSFVLMSDGECNEGSVWEAILFAAHHKLDNLCAIVDVNGLQGMGSTDEVLNLHPLASKWSAFGWNTLELDGHDHGAIRRALSEADRTRPTCVLCSTVKGKGVSFMENQVEWHYRVPNAEQYQAALNEIESAQ